jgi:type IV pilus assembly protein PilB
MDLPPPVLLAAGFSQADIDEGLTIYEAGGCDGCNDGYKGRVGIYQVMPMLEEIQKIILQGGNTMEIAAAAKAAGVNDLRASALLKVKQGLTSLIEIDRVTKE